jgi:hypothetical protein
MGLGHDFAPVAAFVSERPLCPSLHPVSVCPLAVGSCRVAFILRLLSSEPRNRPRISRQRSSWQTIPVIPSGCEQLLNRLVPVIGDPLTLVGDPLTLVGDPLTLVGGLVTLVGGLVTLVGGLVTLVGGLLAPVGGLLAPVGGLVTLVRGPMQPVTMVALEAKPAGLHTYRVRHPQGPCRPRTAYGGIWLLHRAAVRQRVVCFPALAIAGFTRIGRRALIGTHRRGEAVTRARALGLLAPSARRR